MPLFLISAESIQEDQILLGPSEAHHLGHVLRKKIGDVITLTHGRGKYFEAEIIETRGGMRLKILSSTENPLENRPQIILGQGVLKGPRMDWLVEKATELGVSQLLPLVCERSVVRPRSSAEQLKKTQRWTRISEAGLKQSARAQLPQIGPFLTFAEWMERSRDVDTTKILFLSEKDPSFPSLEEIVMKDRPSPFWWALIGPEGGLSAKEIALAKEGGFLPASLGNHTLRAETAALAALSILNYLKDRS